jgi:hypothetical protein
MTINKAEPPLRENPIMKPSHQGNPLGRYYGDSERFWHEQEDFRCSCRGWE